MTHGFARLAILLAVLGLATDALARKGEIIIGQASVRDGDTLEIRGERIRLHGIDAPEREQICRSADGSPFRCGTEAARALDAHIGRRQVACQVMDVDRWGRLVARCDVPASRSGAITGSLNRFLAQSGFVYAMPRFSRDYVGDVDRARRARVGFWAGTFEDPSEFRRRQSGR